MRGGATMHGPVPHSHEFGLLKKVRALGMRMALSGKALDRKLVVIESEKVAGPKTRDLKKLIDGFGFKKALFVGGAELDGNFKLALANIENMDALPAIGANVYDILNHETLVLTKDGLAALVKRLEV
jgi:large subunit ribosomal protein L4